MIENEKLTEAVGNLGMVAVMFYDDVEIDIRMAPGEYLTDRALDVLKYAYIPRTDYKRLMTMLKRRGLETHSATIIATYRLHEALSIWIQNNSDNSEVVERYQQASKYAGHFKQTIDPRLRRILDGTVDELFADPDGFQAVQDFVV